MAMRNEDINLDNAAFYGMDVPDCPAIRSIIRNYELIYHAARNVMIRRMTALRKENEVGRILAVQDTNELLIDGKAAVKVIYETRLLGSIVNTHELISMEGLVAEMKRTVDSTKTLENEEIDVL